MKMLRKGDEFKRVPHSTNADRQALQNLLDKGWKHCDRSTWKRMCRDKGKIDDKN